MKRIISIILIICALKCICLYTQACTPEETESQEEKLTDEYPYIDYDYIEQYHDILFHNITTAPKDDYDDTVLAEYLKEDIEKDKELLKKGSGEERPLTIAYHVFDFNDDGLEDYLVCLEGTFWRYDDKNTVRIYMQEQNGTLREAFTGYVYFCRPDNQPPVAVLAERVEGCHSLALPGPDSLLRYDKEREQYEFCEVESNAEEENVADEIHVGMNEEEYAEKKEMYENIKRINMSVYIDYEFIEAKHEILKHNIITEPKDANENALLKEALKGDMEDAQQMYERGIISSPLYIDYFSFDFNDDGLEDYLVCYHGSGWSGTAGNHVCIYIQKSDGTLSSVFSITMRLYDYVSRYDHSPMAILDEKDDGYYAFVLVGNNRIIRYNKEEKKYQFEDEIDGYRDLIFVRHNDLMGYCNRCIGFFPLLMSSNKELGLEYFPELKSMQNIIEQVIPETAIAIENRYIGKKEKRNPDVRPKIDRNIPLEEIAEKIEYLYTYEKMLCEVSASSRYEELEPLPEGRMRMTIYMVEGNKVLFLPEGAGNKEVLINGELCKLYYSEEREGYLFYFIDDCEENEGGVPVNAVGNGGWEEWFGVCIMEGESQPYSDSRYYTYYPRFDFAGLYKIGEIEVNLDAQKQISLPDIDVQGNEYIESMIRAVQRTLAEKENYGDFEMYLGTYGRMSYGRNENLTVFKASGCVIGKDLEQYFYFTIYDACPEGTVISAAVPYYPPSEQEYESGKYYFTGGEWLPVANQEERIQKIKEIERVVIPFTVIEGEDYEDGEEHEVCDEKKHEEAEKIDFDTMSAEEAINMISYLYSYSEWFGMYELGCPVGEVRGLKDKELIIYTDNSGEWLYFIPADKANEVFVCEDGREYPVYINEEGSAEFYSIRWNPAAVKKEQLKTTLWMIRSTDLKTSLEDYVMLGRKTLEIQDFSLLETPEVESDEYVEALEDYIGDLLAKAEKYGEYKVYIGEYEAMDANRGKR